MRWLGIINLSLVVVIVVMTALFVFARSDEENVLSVIGMRENFPLHETKKELPKSPFSESEEYFHAIGEGFITLKWVPPQMLLPDLRQELIFYGRNLRPDILPGQMGIHLGLKGSREKIFFPEHQRIYLHYRGGYEKPKGLSCEPANPSSPRPLWGDVTHSKDNTLISYTFSPNNQPTPLWLEAKILNDKTLEVQVSMLDEKGAIVTSPNELRSFTIAQQDFQRSELVGWDLGGYRVDSTLLVRQKARWIGPDRFLEMHGGEEFDFAYGRHRIDFFDTSTCSCFVKEGDCFIWKDGKWHFRTDFQNTQNLPLLVVTRIDEKVMTFDLWDAEGKSKMVLSLVRTIDPPGTININQEFKFVGAKTWAQFIVECRNGTRMTLKPNDWLVLTQSGWIKLDTPDLIDQYVDHTLSGPLFILDAMSKQNGRQVLLGHLFNTSRTEVSQVELSIDANANALGNIYRRIPALPPIGGKIDQQKG